MNKETENHIDELLYDSGLFPSKIKKPKNKVSFNFLNEIILITGAAGSIGSGLVEQLIDCKYKKLILIDKAESPLYQLIKQLEFKDTSNIDFILLDITDKKSVKHLFKTHRPSLVFHTAAYKHVPLMEQNPLEAIKVNVFGTKLLANFSNKYKVRKFIFISTDKAVNPKSVMGITKKIGENYLNYLNSKNLTQFITTRFGNILGSNGSVVPLLKKQIESGQPITITDKTISRYFISKYKACSLILTIASKNNWKDNAYTFNMGQPIKISDVIDRLILKCDTIKDNIKVKEIGLRAGEKLHEAITTDIEVLIPTDIEDILIIKQTVSQEINKNSFAKLKKIKPKTDNQKIKSILKLYI